MIDRHPVGDSKSLKKDEVSIGILDMNVLFNQPKLIPAC